MTESHPHGMTVGAASPARTPSGRLLVTLGLAGALAGGLIVSVYQATLPRIEAHRAALVEAAVREVLKNPTRWDTLYLEPNGLTRKLPAGADPARAERVFWGYDGRDRPVGAAIVAGQPGFADVVTLMFGLDPASGTVLGMKVLGSKETPGLGDRIERDTAFTSQFPGALTPLLGVKTRVGRDPSQVAVITGATISSRTVIRIINQATARWRPLLQRYGERGSP